MLHRAFFFQFTHNTRNRRGLLAYGNIDALDARALLIDDRIDSDGGLAGLAVANDQLTLSAADWHHRINGLQSGLHGLIDRLTLNYARRDLLDRRRLCRINRTLAIDWRTQCINNSSQQRLTDGHFKNTAGGLYRVAFRDVLVFTEYNRAHRILLEVQGHTECVSRELEHFAVT